MRGAAAWNTRSIVSGRLKSKSGRPTRTTPAALASAEATWPAPPVTRIGRSGMEPPLTIAQARQQLVLIGQDKLGFRHRPFDPDIRVVPDHATLRRLIV